MSGYRDNEYSEGDFAQRRRMSADGVLRLWAPAKINLNLHVGPVRRDGYHPLDSVVARINLYDVIELHSRSRDPFFVCAGRDCGPEDDNLVIRAYRLLAKGRDVPKLGGVVLEKHIAPGGGLGGGSSDAAAVLAGLNELWGLNLPDDELRTMAACLGSDVPLFLAPPGCRMTGRGEILEPVEVYPFWAVLTMPEIHCPTGPVYQAFDDARTNKMSPQLDTEILVQPPSKWRHRLRNDLTDPAGRVAPELLTVRESLASSVKLPVCMSGSGSTFFVLCDDRDEADAVLQRIGGELRRQSRIVRMNPW